MFKSDNRYFLGFAETALETPKYSSVKKDPRTTFETYSYRYWIACFWIAFSTATVFVTSVIIEYATQDVFSRYVEQREVANESFLSFPKIYICNNVKQDLAPDYPSHIDCKIFPNLFELGNEPCEPNQPFQTLTLLNRTCIVYNGLTARSRNNLLRVKVDVGNHSSVYAPWKGAFMFLKSLHSETPTELQDIEQWKILEAQRYLLVQLRVYRKTKTLDSQEKPEPKEDKYKTEVGHSALVGYYTGTQSNRTAVVIDFFFQSFDVETITTFHLRNYSLFIADVEGAASVFGIIIMILSFFYAVASCIYRFRHPEADDYSDL